MRISPWRPTDIPTRSRIAAAVGHPSPESEATPAEQGPVDRRDRRPEGHSRRPARWSSLRDPPRHAPAPRNTRTDPRSTGGFLVLLPWTGPLGSTQHRAPCRPAGGRRLRDRKARAFCTQRCPVRWNVHDGRLPRRVLITRVEGCPFTRHRFPPSTSTHRPWPTRNSILSSKQPAFGLSPRSSVMTQQQQCRPGASAPRMLPAATPGSARSREPPGRQPLRTTREAAAHGS